MTEPKPLDDDTAAYISMLEGIVAVLAIKCGMNPEVLMNNALRDIVETANMQTMDTDRLINARWKGRNITSGIQAARMAPISGARPSATVPTPQVETITVDFAERARQHRRKRPVTSNESTEPASDVVTEEDSPA